MKGRRTPEVDQEELEYLLSRPVPIEVLAFLNPALAEVQGTFTTQDQLPMNTVARKNTAETLKVIMHQVFDEPLAVIITTG